MGQQPRPSQHKKKKTEERGGSTLISEEVGQVSYRTAFLLTPDEQQRPQPPSFITPLATSSKAPRTEAPASSGPLTEKQNLRHDHRPLDLHFYKVPRRFLYMHDQYAYKGISICIFALSFLFPEEHFLNLFISNLILIYSGIIPDARVIVEK